MADAHIYQIFYNEETRGQLDPGFAPLDNLSNERPDWREYWPMRRFLLGRTMVENDYYGFFSPRFREKTNLSSDQVREFIGRSGNNADVVIFSPFSDMSSLFLNVFEQGDFFRPGLLQTAQDFADLIGLDVSIENIVTDSRNTVFCNYFVARPRFWTAWLDVNEKLFHAAEIGSENRDLQNRLNSVFKRRNELVQFKVLILERVASLILATTRRFSTKAYNPFMLSRSHTRFRKFTLESVVCDALKISLVEQNYAGYKEAFFHVRQRVREAIKK